MPVDTIAVHENQVKIIDQTLLPLKMEYITIHTIGEMWEAIKVLRIRGAPAIGIAAAFGVFLGVKESRAQDFDTFWKDVEKATDFLASARPTAVNLFWALDRIKKLVQYNREHSISELKKVIFDEAVCMIKEDNAICRTLGEFGADLLNDGDGVLTHCNAGGLATARYGTALAPIYVAKEQGKHITVFSDETRPLLQGARLTAWELHQEGIPVTLICDNMAAAVMAKGWVQAVIVGTDRTAANGDVANKIGTYGVAILAKEHGIPFYVAAPTSSIDMTLSHGDQISIEERAAEEITHGFGLQTAPEGIRVYNPAFDVTPNRYVTGIITEKDVVYPPYSENLKKLF
ncbi:MAG: S-methyl-5-thioribose-1-phosphate isomerase [Candidatus Omnitrophota bacterium]|jgi:methylthioribose-1-phosphate isomerase|nr:MAG: S-methyl-5-thioribose-1-phosphate isomerase [Candidatus Omnitrophota bacterium]